MGKRVDNQASVSFTGQQAPKWAMPRVQASIMERNGQKCHQKPGKSLEIALRCSSKEFWLAERRTFSVVSGSDCGMDQ